jgi:steroid delta-isomerase-like uncharacterized protein
MGDKELRELARDSIEAFNRADWDQWKKLHAPNVVYEEIATDRHLTGHDEVLKAFKGWRTAFPDLKGKVSDIVVGEHEVVCQVEWKGTHKGELKAPFGTIPPSGKTNTTKAMIFMKVEKDKIVLNRQYFDFYGMLRKIGALPEKLTKVAGA